MATGATDNDDCQALTLLAPAVRWPVRDCSAEREAAFAEDPRGGSTGAGLYPDDGLLEPVHEL